MREARERAFGAEEIAQIMPRTRQRCLEPADAMEDDGEIPNAETFELYKPPVQERPPWVCHCGTLVLARAIFCPKPECDGRREPDETDARFQELYPLYTSHLLSWPCMRCKVINDPDYTTCFCGARRPADFWICPRCGSFNSSANLSCGNNGCYYQNRYTIQERARYKSFEASVYEWRCETCRTSNPASRVYCTRCPTDFRGAVTVDSSTLVPYTTLGGMAVPVFVSEPRPVRRVDRGRWVCDMCYTKNPLTLAFCARGCQYVRERDPRIGTLPGCELCRLANAAHRCRTAGCRGLQLCIACMEHVRGGRRRARPCDSCHSTAEPEPVDVMALALPLMTFRRCALSCNMPTLNFAMCGGCGYEIEMCANCAAARAAYSREHGVPVDWGCKVCHRMAELGRKEEDEEFDVEESGHAFGMEVSFDSSDSSMQCTME